MAGAAANREILVSGWGRESPLLPYAPARVVPLARLHESLATLRHDAVLVLGDDALHDLSPDTVGRLTGFPRCVVLAVPRRVSVEVVAAWARSGHAAIVAPERLVVRLREVAGLPSRCPVPETAWVPPPATRNTLAAMAVRTLPTLPELTIRGWADRLGIHRHALQRACYQGFRCTPSDLRWRFVLAVTRDERARGWTVAEVARSLGYDDSRSLWRLFRSRRKEMPPRKTAGQRSVAPSPFPNATPPTKVPQSAEP